MDAVANFAYSTVSAAPSPATTGTSLKVVSGTVFPAVPFNAVIWPALEIPLSTTAEIVRVTANAAGTFTIVRREEGTAARTVIVGDQIMCAYTKRSYDELSAVATKPAVAAEGTVKVGVVGVDRVLLANIKGNGVLQSFKIKHGFKTFSVLVTVQTNVAEHPGEVTTVKKWVAISEEEVEVEFNAVVAAGTVFWIKVEG